MVYVLYRHAKNIRHVSPQNRFTLKEFETTTREIGLIIFLMQPSYKIQVGVAEKSSRESKGYISGYQN